MDIRLNTLLINLKDFPFDVRPAYRIDENQAKDIISALEDLKEMEESKKVNE